MEIKTIEISGFLSCFNSLRKPFKKEVRSLLCENNSIVNNDNDFIFKSSSYVEINQKDLELLMSLIKRGDEHSKALRLINVTAEVKAPLFFWSEMDTYEIGVVNGCSESTMHTILKSNLSIDDFDSLNVTFIHYIISEIIKIKLSNLNSVEKILKIKEILPSSFLQTRDINFSYQTLRRIYKQRLNHKLPQWKFFCNWIESLPLSNNLLIN